METDCEQIKKNVIRRVNRIHVWRTYTRPIVIESTLLGMLIGGALCMVSARHIIANAYSSQSLGALEEFAIKAFEKTEFSMKALSLAVGVLLLLIARDMFGGLFVAVRRIRSSFS